MEARALVLAVEFMLDGAVRNGSVAEGAGLAITQSPSACGRSREKWSCNFSIYRSSLQ
jgi:hypothetical protein